MDMRCQVNFTVPGTTFIRITCGFMGPWANFIQMLLKFIRHAYFL